MTRIKLEVLIHTYDNKDQKVFCIRHFKGMSRKRLTPKKDKRRGGGEMKN